jgi:hypothetical protein
MPPYRARYDPGGRTLSDRLDRLRDTFDDLAVRLRSAVADAVGETLGDVIREAVLRTLNGLAGNAAADRRPSSSSRWDDPYCRSDDERGLNAWRQQDRPDGDGHGLWRDDERFEDDDSEPDAERRPKTATPSVPVVAAAAGLQAAAWWLMGWKGRRHVVSTIAVGLLTTGLAYLVPSLANAVLNLAGSAVQLGALGNACGSTGPLLSSLGLG